jgi:hypothetical protein
MDSDVDIPSDLTCLTDRARLYLHKRKRARSPGGRGSGPPDPVDPAVDAEFDPDMVRARKRLRRILVRNASVPTVAVALRSRRAERLAWRKRKGAAQSCRPRRGDAS